jgi:hypothetical protein
MSESRYIQSKYTPMNPSKYEGDPTGIICRSSWERMVAKWCDTNPGVISWSSEEIIVPYVDPIDKRWHRYFVDFKIKVKTKEGIQTYLIEVKPHKQTEKPVEPKRKTPKSHARYLAEVRTYIKNKAKWAAAEEYAKHRSSKFMVLTEYDLGLKK